jgi:hypothetical protein
MTGNAREPIDDILALRVWVLRHVKNSSSYIL